MISETPLSIKERQFPGSFVRSCCQHIYGARLHHGTYGNWRSWAGIPKGQRRIEYGHFCRLVVIAYIRGRQSPEDRVTELRESMINRVAESVETQLQVAAIVHRFDELGWVMGGDAPIALQSAGVRVSRRSLYRNIPGFSAVKVYKIDYLKEMCRA
jgi:hypothetical protein